MARKPQGSQATGKAPSRQSRPVIPEPVKQWWRRRRLRTKVGIIAGTVVALFVAVALAAPSEEQAPPASPGTTETAAARETASATATATGTNAAASPTAPSISGTGSSGGPGGSPTQTVAGGAPVAANLTEATVDRIVDGDTLDVRIGGQTYRVRLIGIDTPEVYSGVECFGREASARTAALAPPGTRVRLEKDVSETDRYGRLLRYVWLPDGRMLNEVLVREGYAQVSTYPPDVKYQDRFLAAQRAARDEGAGLWGACGGAAPQPTPTSPPPSAPQPTTPPPTPTPTPTPPPPPPPPSGSASVPPVDEYNCPPSHPIKGNRGSNGWIYHMPGGAYYDRTKPEECFATAADAEAAGYRPSSR